MEVTPIISVDKTELESAIVNIAMNFKDALPNGGRVVIRYQNLQLPATNDVLLAADHIFCCLRRHEG